jgi:alkylmercury lyase
LDDTGAELTVAGFQALFGGRAVQPAELLPGDGQRASQVAGELARGGCGELDDDGRLVGIHGLTLRVTRHGFIHDGRNYHTWCAFDLIGIPAALRLDATAHTNCPSCGASLAVDIVGGEPSASSSVLWFPATTGRNVMEEFCARADLYCSLEHLDMTIDTDQEAGRVVTLSSAATLGRQGWADIA